MVVGAKRSTVVVDSSTSVVSLSVVVDSSLTVELTGVAAPSSSSASWSAWGATEPGTAASTSSASLDRVVATAMDAVRPR